MDNNTSLPDALAVSPYGPHKVTQQDRLFIFDAFISHASIDIPQSRALSEELSARGLRVWHDEEQNMDDARWALRIETALCDSRFVIVMAGRDSDLMNRYWVPIECRSALASEASLPGISRLLIARMTSDSPIPVEFANCETFDLPSQINLLVACVLRGNQLPPLGAAPAEISLTDAKDLMVLASAPIAPRQRSSTEPERAKERLLDAFLTSARNALTETESDPQAPSHSLYQISMLSQSQLEDCVCNETVRVMVPIFEFLTGVGRTESRANACFVLRGLAIWGASIAAAALRRVILREEHKDLVNLIAEWFGTVEGLDSNSLTVEECARVLLKLPRANIALRNDLLARLPRELRVVALPGVAALATEHAFGQLGDAAHADQAQARFEQLVQDGSPFDWEVYFRERASRFDADLLVHLDCVPPSQPVEAYLLLVNKFAGVELERGGNLIWRMCYASALLSPLANLSAYPRYRDRAMATFNTVLDAMEVPVLKDLEASRSKFVRPKRELEQMARLSSIEAFRRGPYFELSEQGIYVTLSSIPDTAARHRLVEKILKTPDDTHPVDDAWNGLQDLLGPPREWE